MTSGPISTKKFVAWLIVFSLGAFLWGWPRGIPTFSGMLMGLSSFIIMPAEERTRPIAFRELIWPAIFIVLLVLLGVTSKLWFPENLRPPIERVVRHPAFVAPLWALAVWNVYRRYKASRSNLPENTNPAELSS